MTVEIRELDLTGNPTVEMTVDCHAYPWHLEDPEYAECGPENLTRMAEEFGVLVAHLPDGPYPNGQWADWAWWYVIIGPAENVVRLLANEYAGGDAEARELVECGAEPCPDPAARWAAIQEARPE